MSETANGADAPTLECVFSESAKAVVDYMIWRERREAVFRTEYFSSHPMFTGEEPGYNACYIWISATVP